MIAAQKGGVNCLSIPNTLGNTSEWRNNAAFLNAVIHRVESNVVPTIIVGDGAFKDTPSMTSVPQTIRNEIKKLLKYPDGGITVYSQRVQNATQKLSNISETAGEAEISALQHKIKNWQEVIEALKRYQSSIKKTEEIKGSLLHYTNLLYSWTSVLQDGLSDDVRDNARQLKREGAPHVTDKWLEQQSELKYKFLKFVIESTFTKESAFHEASPIIIENFGEIYFTLKSLLDNENLSHEYLVTRLNLSKDTSVSYLRELLGSIGDLLTRFDDLMREVAYRKDKNFDGLESQLTRLFSSPEQKKILPLFVKWASQPKTLTEDLLPAIQFTADYRLTPLTRWATSSYKKTLDVDSNKNALTNLETNIVDTWYDYKHSHHALIQLLTSKLFLDYFNNKKNTIFKPLIATSISHPFPHLTTELITQLLGFELISKRPDDILMYVTKKYEKTCSAHGLELDKLPKPLIEVQTLSRLLKILKKGQSLSKGNKKKSAMSFSEILTALPGLKPDHIQKDLALFLDSETLRHLFTPETYDYRHVIDAIYTTLPTILFKIQVQILDLNFNSQTLRQNDPRRIIWEELIPLTELVLGGLQDAVTPQSKLAAAKFKHKIGLAHVMLGVTNIRRYQRDYHTELIFTKSYGKSAKYIQVIEQPSKPLRPSRVSQKLLQSFLSSDYPISKIPDNVSVVVFGTPGMGTNRSRLHTIENLINQVQAMDPHNKKGHPSTYLGIGIPNVGHGGPDIDAVPNLDAYLDYLYHFFSYYKQQSTYVDKNGHKQKRRFVFAFRSTMPTVLMELYTRFPKLFDAQSDAFVLISPVIPRGYPKGVLLPSEIHHAAQRGELVLVDSKDSTYKHQLEIEDIAYFQYDDPKLRNKGQWYYDLEGANNLAPVSDAEYQARLNLELFLYAFHINKGATWMDKLVNDKNWLQIPTFVGYGELDVEYQKVFPELISLMQDVQANQQNWYPSFYRQGFHNLMDPRGTHQAYRSFFSMFKRFVQDPHTYHRGLFQDKDKNSLPETNLWVPTAISFFK